MSNGDNYLLLSRNVEVLGFNFQSYQCAEDNMCYELKLEGVGIETRCDQSNQCDECCLETFTSKLTISDLDTDESTLTRGMFSTTLPSSSRELVLLHGGIGYLRAF
ncbi:hypothetical protein RF11_05448 [Thelohanellus kitauei]|uniref:Uncharacterized protein n=1 Tax=Thelohanellus kitauei TaxID=669202 RepID=A0A0C2MVM3_THEKT|nr:hypothetical protein RF11_05448 [Thelohanellus kitauei]